jgi:prepilin signal peptidase PulO-like enzyme (type II secretory pathway)
MIIAILVVAGLCFGSFVNALVWRLHEQEAVHGGKSKKHLSITKGRSMCPHCRHELAPKDLVPVLSWLFLKGKCRYCRKPISPQYPLVELAGAVLYTASYIWWPETFTPSQVALLVLWLGFLTLALALLVYDLRWFTLPDRIVVPLGGLAAAQAVIVVLTADHPLTALLNVAPAVIVGGGLFYVLFQVSDGKWIGGGDVKLGVVLGLVAATPAGSFLMIFLASLLGSLTSLPLLATHRLKKGSMIPFGPFLIIGLVIVRLFGADLFDWYRQTFINF